MSVRDPSTAQSRSGSIGPGILDGLFWCVCCDSNSARCIQACMSVTPLRLVVQVFMWHSLVLSFDSDPEGWLLRTRDGSVAVAQVLDSVCVLTLTFWRGGFPWLPRLCSSRVGCSRVRELEDDSSTLPLPVCDVWAAIVSAPMMSARFVWGPGNPVFSLVVMKPNAFVRCMMPTQASRSSHTLRDEVRKGSGRPAQTSLSVPRVC